MPIVYHPTRKYSVRPYNFRLAPDRPLSQGCVFAGLGALAGSSRYYDSSVYGIYGDSTTTNWKNNSRPFIYLDGTDYVDFDEVKQTQLTSGFSVSCWCKPGSLGQYDVFACNCSYDGKGWRLWTRDSSAFKYYFEVYDGAGKNVSYTAGTDWSHVCGIHTGSALQLYINGALEDTTTSVGAVQYSVVYKIKQVIGAMIAVGGGMHREAQCSISDTLIHNRVLTPAEIQALANPADPMLGDWVQPIPTESYFLPLGEAPQPTRVGKIFKSRIIRGVA